MYLTAGQAARATYTVATPGNRVVYREPRKLKGARTMAKTLRTDANTLAGEARALLERLCRQPSVAAQGLGIGAMADLVEGLLAETGFRTQRFAIADAPPIVFGELAGGPFTVLLYDHYDVSRRSRWNCGRRRRSSRVRDGKLYGRAR